MKIEVSRTLPVTRREGYATLLDVAAWGEWTPFHTVGEDHVLAHAGDEVAFDYRVLGIPVRGRLLLEEASEPALIRFLLDFPGVPTIYGMVRLQASGTKAIVVTFDLLSQERRNWLTMSLEWIAIVPALVRHELRRSLDRLHDLMLASDADHEAAA